MTFEERLAALEAAANQLPASLAVLQRKLEQNWQPDAAVLLQAGSVTPEMLTVKMTRARTLTAAAMPVGLTILAVDVSGLASVTGIFVGGLQASSHNSWTWYPTIALSAIVFSNTGIAQTVNVSYHVVGT